MYTFIGRDGRKREQYHVYKHHDGYPINGTSGAVFWLKAALNYAWPLPRYEADDFAAAFVAANKLSGEDLRKEQIADYRERIKRYKKEGTDTSFEEGMYAKLLRRQQTPSGQGGGVRLMETARDWRKIAPWDLSYRYEVEHLEGEKDLTVRAYRIYHVDDDHPNKETWEEELLFTSALSHSDVQAKLWQVQDEQA
jgi:GNAT superfamily N-acetyltransferase